ncbi:MAG: AlpA family phage regulatory protein [Erythrobacter sp.]|nr:AlpA family phage regulatory protein [Erythrobacter sp.]MBA4079807.1 AlpA family phage regulatory protein [Erythrobacter sp.]
MTANPNAREASVTSAENTPACAPPPRLLRLPEVMDRVGLRRSAIYQRMSEGRFPKCRTLGPKCSVWVETEINEWVRSVAENKS